MYAVSLEEVLKTRQPSSNNPFLFLLLFALVYKDLNYVYKGLNYVYKGLSYVYKGLNYVYKDLN